MNEARPTVLVSACLLGIRCRYDGSTNPAGELDALLEGKHVVAICPEEMGSLPTPRPAAQLHGGSAADVLDGKAIVRTHQGNDVTAEFLQGAQQVARIAAEMGAQTAILKERSPSCGVCCVHRDGQLVEGRGVAAEALARMGVQLTSLDPPKQR